MATWGDFDPAWANRQAPSWYRDAKLGIFVHWGIYSVPGWAPPSGDFSGHNDPDWDWRAWFANNAYAEWYENTLGIEGSPTSKYHREHYGDAPYTAFAPLFAEAVKSWDPAPWAKLFRRAGARYVIPTTKHHDGYCLWPTRVENPNTPNWHSERDLIGEFLLYRVGLPAGSLLRPLGERRHLAKPRRKDVSERTALMPAHLR